MPSCFRVMKRLCCIEFPLVFEQFYIYWRVTRNGMGRRRHISAWHLSVQWDRRRFEHLAVITIEPNLKINIRSDLWDLNCWSHAAQTLRSCLCLAKFVKVYCTYTWWFAAADYSRQGFFLSWPSWELREFGGHGGLVIDNQRRSLGRFGMAQVIYEFWDLSAPGASVIRIKSVVLLASSQILIGKTFRNYSGLGLVAWAWVLLVSRIFGIWMDGMDLERFGISDDAIPSLLRGSDVRI